MCDAGREGKGGSWGREEGGSGGHGEEARGGQAGGQPETKGSGGMWLCDI